MATITNETEPLETLKALLVVKWKPSAGFPLPSIDIVNDPEDAISRVDFSGGDYITLSEPSPSQTESKETSPHLHLGK